MIRLIYVSKAHSRMSSDELVELMRVSKSNNAPLDITGMLLYRNGEFMQVLEGPEQAVHTLYDKIKQDARHRDVKTVRVEPINVREFDRWSMGFKNLDALSDEDRAAYSNFLTEPLYKAGNGNAALVNQLLLAFKSSLSVH